MASKIKRYETTVRSKKHNDLFTKNRKQFYREIETEAKFDIPTPPSEAELREFWGEKIFGQGDLYNEHAEWIPEWRKQYECLQEQEWNDINVIDLSNQLSRQLNWKAPGLKNWRGLF